MSFSDPLSIFLQLPETPAILQPTLSTSKRPKSYHPPSLNRRYSIASRRDSISSQPNSIDHAFLDQANPVFTISGASDDTFSHSIQSPPPVYGHNSSRKYHDQHGHPPTYYNNRSCNMRRSASYHIPRRTITNHRKSRAFMRTVPQTINNYRDSITILPIPQFPSDPPGYASPITQQLADYTTSNRRISFLIESTESIPADFSTSTVVSSTPPTFKREPLSFPAMCPPITVSTSTGTLANPPPRPSLTLQIPEMAMHSLSDATYESDWESEYDLMLQGNMVASGKDKGKVDMRQEKQSRCCGFSWNKWVISWSFASWSRQELEEEKREGG